MDQTTPNHPTPDYKTLYPLDPNNLLEETPEFTTHESIVLYRKSESFHKSRIFGKEHDKFVRVVPCMVNEPICCDESSDLEGPFCFIYSTIFKKLSLHLPFSNFERGLLTEIPSNFLKESTYNSRDSKPSNSTPKWPPKTSSKKCSFHSLILFVKTNRGRIGALYVVILHFYGVFKTAIDCSCHSFDSP